MKRCPRNILICPVIVAHRYAYIHIHCTREESCFVVFLPDSDVYIEGLHNKQILIILTLITHEYDNTHVTIMSMIIIIIAINNTNTINNIDNDS